MLVAPGVRRLRAANPSPMTGDGTNTYLIGERRVVVVDPGPDLASHVDHILTSVEQHDGQVVALLVSHQHPDHLPAAYTIRRQTGAPILAHPSLPGLDQALDDGMTVGSELGPLTALATPGHADDHLCFWLSAPRLLFAGDLVAGVGTVVLSTSPCALNAYLGSLRRLLGLGQATILPGHGPVVADSLVHVQAYLDHRAERDRQILAALAIGRCRVEQIVDQVYADIRPELRPMATRNVNAHLEHLLAAGLVQRHDEAWRGANSAD